MDIKKAFRYCPRCGRGFQIQDGHLQCGACGLSYYLNPKPTTAVILVNDEGQYLLVKRAIEPGEGLWDLPGGFVEENETFEDNAKREIKEELDIDIDGLHYVGSSTEPYLFQDVIHPTLAACFVARFPSGSKPQPADDVSNYGFFDADKLPVDKFAFQAMHRDFEAAAKFLKQRGL